MTGELLERYCAAQYERLARYRDVARKLGLDWRTVKARVEASARRSQ